MARGWVGLVGSVSSSVVRIHSLKPRIHGIKPLGLVHYKQVTNLNGLGLFVVWLFEARKGLKRLK